MNDDVKVMELVEDTVSNHSKGEIGDFLRRWKMIVLPSFDVLVKSYIAR